MNWDYFTFLIMGVIFLLVVFLLFFFGDLPGKIARKRGHPQADAINVCSWIGLAAGGVGWVIALVWAYTRPLGITVAPKLDTTTTDDMGAQELTAEIVGLRARLADLEHRLEEKTQHQASKGDAS